MAVGFTSCWEGKYPEKIATDSGSAPRLATDFVGSLLPTLPRGHLAHLSLLQLPGSSAFDIQRHVTVVLEHMVSSYPTILWAANDFLCDRERGPCPQTYPWCAHGAFRQQSSCTILLTAEERRSWIGIRQLAHQQFTHRLFGAFICNAGACGICRVANRLKWKRRRCARCMLYILLTVSLAGVRLSTLTKTLDPDLHTHYSSNLPASSRNVSMWKPADMHPPPVVPR